MDNCPKCKSDDIECIGFRSGYISLDDYYTISEFICNNCDYNWEW